MNYIYTVDDSPYLSHYGIKGMQWGHRRFQDATGALTEAGRAHYGYAKKAARFGVALGKAKAEHYGKQLKAQARESYRDLNRDAKNLKANIKRIQDPYYYKNKSNRDVWDYYLKKKANQNQVLKAQREVAHRQEIGRQYIENAQATSLELARFDAETNSRNRYNYRNSDALLNRDFPSMPSTMRNAGRAYIEGEHQKEALSSLKWQDFFEPASPESYSISYSSRERLRNRMYNPY